MPKRALGVAAIWIIAMTVALRVDFPVARWVHESGIGKRIEGRRWAQVVKAPGTFPFTVCAAIVLLVMRQIRWKQAVFVVLAGIVAGANAFIKWIVGRTRPYKLPGTSGLRPFDLQPFWHGLKGLFSPKDLCFPSGHASVAFALACSMVFVWPRGAWIFALLAISVGFERVLENAHFTSDVIGAVGFAILATWLLYTVMQDWMNAVPQAAQPSSVEAR